MAFPSESKPGTPGSKQRREPADPTDHYLCELPAGHIIHTFYSEHRIILSYLLELDDVREKIWQLDTPIDHPELIVKLIDLAEQLISMEKHHIREEEVLFPELEKRHIRKFHYVLKSEHLFLREYKVNFLNHVRELSAMDFRSYKLQMNFMANGIIGLLRGHIEKENTDVFPLALRIIEEPEVWTSMEKDCRDIGFCSYIPPQK